MKLALEIKINKLPEQVWIIWTVLDCVSLMAGVLADRASAQIENVFVKYIL